MSAHLRRVLGVGIGTFLISISLNFLSKVALGRVGILLGLLVLLAIIFVGIAFDILGTAVTAAQEGPFHAMAAKKVYGAREAIRLVRNADRVANFSNDLVGDICGTVSGAVGASIVFQLVTSHPHINEVYMSTVAIGMISALTVGGKAYAKTYAMKDAEEIVLLAGKVLAGIEGITRVRLFSKGINSAHGSGARKKNKRNG